MKKLLLFMLVLLSSYAIATNPITQTVRGNIVDRITKSPIPGANVVLLNTDPLRGTTSDTDGRFKLENVEIGRISLKITFVGYHEVILTNLNLQSGKELVLNIEMEEQVIMGEEVIIRARSDKSVTINKLAMISSRGFTVEETERYAGSRNDVARMAANYAGVLGVDDSRNDIIIRGNSPTGLLWRLEGVDIPNPNHWGMTGTTGGPVSMLNNTLLSNSDFMTGAFPAEYGNAISGVFDLHMRNGNNEKYEFLGQIGFNGFELGAEGPINREKGSSFLINYRYSTMGVFDALGMDFGTVGIPYYQDLSFKLHFPKTKIGNLSIFGLGGISDIDIWDSKRDTSKKKLDFYGGEGFDLTNGTDMAVVGVTDHFHIDQNTYAKITFAAMGHRMETVMDSLIPVSLDKVPYYRNQFTEGKLFISTTLNKRITKQHTLRAGFSAKSLNGSLVDSIYDAGISSFRKQVDYKGTSWLINPYIQWQYKLSDAYTINAGIHYMHFFLNNTKSLEPRFGLRWELSKNQVLSFGYGLHSQTANIITYFMQNRLPDGTYSKPNKNLGFTKSHHLVLGYDFKVDAFTRIKAEIYHQYIFDAGVDAIEKNSYSMLNQGASFYFEVPEKLSSTGKGRNYGMELTIERFLNKGFYFLTTCSLYESRYTGSDGIEYNSAFNSHYVVNGLIGKEFMLGKKNEKSRKSLAIDLKTVYAGGKRTTPYSIVKNEITNEFYREWSTNRAFYLKLKDYAKTDLKVTFRVQKQKYSHEWAIEITNLFDNQNIFSDKFNKQDGKTEYTYQVGLMMIPQYRIVF